jgi:hypothetical protein
MIENLPGSCEMSSKSLEGSEDGGVSDEVEMFYCFVRDGEELGWGRSRWGLVRDVGVGWKWTWSGGGL